MAQEYTEMEDTEAHYHLESMPPPQYPREARSRGGYYKLPTSDFPFTADPYQPSAPPPNIVPPPPSYSPYYAPAESQQQPFNNTNAVIVQPSTMPQQVMGIQTEPANTSIVLTILLMVLCLLVVNLPAMICLIPALIFSVLAMDHNAAGKYSEAKTCGRYALFCNLGSIIFVVVIGIVGVIAAAVFFIGEFTR